MHKARQQKSKPSSKSAASTHTSKPHKSRSLQKHTRTTTQRKQKRLASTKSQHNTISPPKPTLLSPFLNLKRQSNSYNSFSTTTMSSSPDSSPDFGSKVKVYTKTGDKGTTTLYNMQRLSKASDYFDALGNTDEINSQIGLAREYFTLIPRVSAWRTKNNTSTEEFRLDAVYTTGENDKNNNDKNDEIIDVDMQLQIIQSRLLDLGSCIATPITTSQQNRLSRVSFSSDHITQLENWIDQFDSQLPPLTVFILPSGGLASSTLHVARTIARRSERSVIPLVERGDCEDVVMKYLNRLSDYLFMAARYSALVEGKGEVTYKKPTERQLKINQDETGLRTGGKKD